MKFLRLLLLSFLLIACKDKEKDFSKKNGTQKEQGEFFVEFNPLDSTYCKKQKKEIEYRYNQLINKNDFYGQFLVAKNGKILFEDYEGFAYKEKDDKNRKDKPLHIASVSKVLTAAVILRMVDQGKIGLDDKVSKYLKGFYHDDITVRMLLNHRSGLRHYGYFIERDVKWDKSKRITNQDILDLINSGKIHLESNPGTRFAYCNTNYSLLALIIEKVSGMRYHEAMDKLLFKPLGMKNSFVFDYEKHHDTVSQTYKASKLRLAFDHLDLVYGDKNIYSTARDLLKFDLATYSNKFFSDKLRKEIFKGYSYEAKGEKNYGLGIRLREWKEAPTLTYHNGWWHGNTSSYITQKTDSITIIALSNKMTHKTYQTKKFIALFNKKYPIKLDDSDVSGANE
ncbi:beta-lactamase family protein [Flavobacterium sp. F372]|uniref:Beta-lactamase family protein n=1 Tax=Flavobacterium bernardetii TaxID=2813823 RepID=A0ABR7IUC6_9FLAO|nr:serine hydrolase domain-containing protein [Flavobacterium bernardetii]MBC5833371.1 beta-lactamase family protein [Flavobacterium bernardetii]NHF68603.1 beta-lactamase family protein [Flavobacterium bernardetii]